MWCITIHAVEQFISRWEPEKPYNQAKEELEALIRTSRIIGKTKLGDTIVASGYRPEIRLVIKERNVCVTVLPQGKLEDLHLPLEEELEELLSISKRKILQTKQEIQECEEAVKSIDAQRHKLSMQKHDLCNRIQMLNKRIQKICNFSD